MKRETVICGTPTLLTHTHTKKKSGFFLSVDRLSASVAEQEGDTKAVGSGSAERRGSRYPGGGPGRHACGSPQGRGEGRNGGGGEVGGERGGARPPEGPGTFWKAAREAGAAPACRQCPQGALGASSGNGPEGQAGNRRPAQAQPKRLSLWCNVLPAWSLQPSPPPFTRCWNACENRDFPLEKWK